MPTKKLQKHSSMKKFVRQPRRRMLYLRHFGLTLSASSQLSCLGHEEFSHFYSSRWQERRENSPGSLDKSSNLKENCGIISSNSTTAKRNIDSGHNIFFKILKLQSVWSMYSSNFKKGREKHSPTIRHYLHLGKARMRTKEKLVRFFLKA